MSGAPNSNPPTPNTGTGIDTDHLWNMAQPPAQPQSSGNPLDHLWGQAGGTTAAQPPAPATGYSYEGHAFEQLYSHLAPYYRIAKAFGVAAEQNFGTQELPDVTRNYLQDHGLLKDFSTFTSDLNKNANSAFFWPDVIGGTAKYLATEAPVSAVVATATTIPALLSGVSAATQQVGREFLGKAQETQEQIPGKLGTALATPFGAAGEVTGAIPEGFLGDMSFPHIPTEMSELERLNFNLHQQLDRMRSEGVIGEDDGTFFGTKALTPEQRTARAQAARAAVAGQGPDVHTVARQLAPDIMGPYDELVRYREDLLEAKRTQQQINPDWADKNQELQDHLAKGPGEPGNKNRAYHEQKLREELEQIPQHEPLESTDELETELRVTNQRISELSNSVKDVYSRASEAVGSRVAAVSDIGATQGTPEKEAVSEAPTGSPAVKQAPIQDQVFDKLKEINGRLKTPLTDDQLRVQSKFAERIYVTLGKQWGVDPHVLFREKFPELTGEKPVAGGQTLNQNDNQAPANDDNFRKTPILDTDKQQHDIAAGAHLRAAEAAERLIKIYKEWDGKTPIPDIGKLRREAANLTGEANVQSFSGAFPENDLNVKNIRSVAWETTDLNPDHYELGFDPIKETANLHTIAVNHRWMSVWHEEAAHPNRIPDELNQGTRGSITFRPGQRDLIHLAETADPTTFMHELLHHYVKLLEHIVAKGDAPPELVAHYGTLRTWVNAKAGKPLTEAMHERTARGFEKWLMEGHAPSPELQSMFNTMKQWFVSVYTDLKNLHVNINDSIKGFFNQMIKEGPETEEGTLLGKGPDMVNVAPEDPQDILGRTNDQPVTAAPAPPVKATGDTAPQPGGVPVSSQSGMTLNQSDYISSDGKPNVTNAVRSDADFERYIRSWALHNDKYRDDGQLTLTHSDILELADVYGTKPANLQRNLARMSKMLVDNKVPAVIRVRAIGDLLKANDQAMRDAAVNGDKALVASFAENRLNVQRTIQGVGTAWGQMGHALNTLAIEEKQSEMLSTLFQNSIGRSAEDLDKDMARIRGLDTQAKLSRYANDMVTPSMGQMLEEAFKQYLISGPLTHLQYIEGNRIMSFMRAGPETYVSSVIADLREAVTRKKSLPGQRNWGDTGTVGLQSMLFHQMDGLQAMWDAAEAGQTVLLPGEDAANTPFSSTKYIPGVAGSIIRAPGERMVAAIHSADRTINFHIAKDQLDHNQARDEGLDPREDLEAYTARIAELRANTTPDKLAEAKETLKKIADLKKTVYKEAVPMLDELATEVKAPLQRVADARQVANEIALMSRAGKVTRAVMGFTNLEADLSINGYGLGLTKPMSFITPFVHIAGNLARQGLIERSPIGGLFPSFWRDAMGENGTLAQDTALSKMTVGTAVWGGLGGLYATGHLNGPPSDDYKENAVRTGMGILPNSVRIWHMTFAFDRLGAWGQQMAMGAALWDSFKDHETEGWGRGFQLFGEHLLKHITTEGYMQSISDLFKATDKPDQYLGRWSQNFLASAIVPTLFRQTAQEVDPYQREFRGYMDTIQSRIPFASKYLPAKIDLLGNPIPNKEFWGVYADHMNTDPMWQLLTKSGYSFGPVPEQIRGEQLSTQQHEEFARKAGACLQLLLKKFVDTGAYQNMPATHLYELLAGTQGMVAGSRAQAAGYMIAKYHFGDKNVMKNGTDIGSIALRKKQGLTK